MKTKLNEKASQKLQAILESVGGLFPYQFLLESLPKELEFKEKADEDSGNKLLSFSEQSKL